MNFRLAQFLSQSRAAWLARLAHNQKVAGSNPASATSWASPCGATSWPSPCGATKYARRAALLTRGGGRGLLVSFVGGLRHLIFGCLNIFQIANPAAFLKGYYTPALPALNLANTIKSVPSLWPIGPHSEMALDRRKRIDRKPVLEAVISEALGGVISVNLKIEVSPPGVPGLVNRYLPVFSHRRPRHTSRVIRGRLRLFMDALNRLVGAVLTHCSGFILERTL